MERSPIDENDSGVPVTPAHSPAPEPPSHSLPSPPEDLDGSDERRPLAERASLADDARDKTEGGSSEVGDPATAAQGEEGGPAVPNLTSGMDESNPAQGL